MPGDKGVDLCPPEQHYSLGRARRFVSSRSLDFGSLRGVSVGQAETPDGQSGVTVVLFDTPAAMVVDVRGGASATYDTASLALDATFGRRWAVFFSGGSLYGLDAARGVRTRILEMGRGHRAFANPNIVVPISGAALFDLPSTRGAIPDYLPLGYEAARRAHQGPVETGRFGAGAGATVGKYLGRHRAMPGGLGTAAARFGPRAAVGALVAVNAVGAVRDPATGAWVAGARGPGGRVVPPPARRRAQDRTSGTTLSLVVTDLVVGRPALARVAAIVQAGLASAISPYHSGTDGDVLFVASTEKVPPARAETRPGELADRLGVFAAELAVAAVLSAVRAGRRGR